MARRVVKKKPKMITTTVHPKFFNVMENFRKEYMKLSGNYIGNSMATEMLADKIKRIKPDKRIIRRKKFDGI